jgi:AI-2 transport protein TqsA
MIVARAARPSPLSATPPSPSAQQLAPGTRQTGTVEKDRAGTHHPGAAAAAPRAPSVETAGENDAGLPRIFVVLVVVAALTVTLAGVRSTQVIMAPTFLALVLTITVHPLRARLARWKLPEWAASLIMLLATYLMIVAVCLMLLVSLGRLAVLLPRYEPEMTEILQTIGARLEDLGVGAAQVDAMVRAIDLTGLVPFATDLLSGVLGLLSNVFFIATLLLFMAFDSSATTRALQALAPAKPELIGALRSFVVGTRSYMGASAGFGLVVAVIDALALWMIGVPGAFVWGVLAFVTNFIPNIGFVIGVVPPALIALLEGGPGLMLAVVAVYCLINFVIQSVIQPRVVGDRVGLSATITFLSLVFWTWVVGPLGAILAVPLTLLLRAVLVEADPSAWWVLPLLSGTASDETRHQGSARHPGRRTHAPSAPQQGGRATGMTAG